MTGTADLELEFYEKFFIARGLEPYPVQEQAFDHIFAGRSVLVTVPTGTGKTVIGKAAIHKALALGQKAIYTSPLRALTEEKYRELCEDFGADRVGFATGDYKVNPEAPVQVVVAEILWNRIFGERAGRLADVVVMDEAHYFNDPERGYVWEQSIIGMDPRTQLVLLSATVGDPQQFCAWVYSVRRVEMELVQSHERRVPLYHEYREAYLIEVVRELYDKGDWPAIIFSFSRDQCFEWARLLRSCPRFTTDEERARIEAACDEELLQGGLAKELRALLVHGIGVHHAGILPRYKQLVERLTLERLCKFVVSTETISAGINLPAKRVVFPALRKFIKGKPRLVTSAEYHQMAGRAGRPQFDKEGIAIALAPEGVVQELRKELKELQKRGRAPSEIETERLRKACYARARSQAQAAGDVTWDRETHRKLVEGKPAALASKTKVTPEQILAIGLPDLQAPPPPDGTRLPPYLDLHMRSVIDHLLLDERSKAEARRTLDMIIDNLKALGVLDEHGRQIAGKMINRLRGIDGPFVYYLLMNRDVGYELARELVEFLVDHDVIHRILGREGDEKRREWIHKRLRERRRDEPMVTWEDVEEEYERTFPRELSEVEKVHQEFVAGLPHPELHGGKVQKTIWKKMEEENLSFLEFVSQNGLEHEEGNLFTYLARVMKFARMLHEATTLDEFHELEVRVRRRLSAIDERVLEELW